MVACLILAAVGGGILFLGGSMINLPLILVGTAMFHGLGSLTKIAASHFFTVCLAENYKTKYTYLVQNKSRTENTCRTRETHA